jgi:hypothetical protein
VECAVRCEPVSIPNSLLTAKITGNFSNLATLSDSSYAKTHALQRLQCRFPTQNSRENNYRIREGFAQEQGCFRNSGGGGANPPPSIAPKNGHHVPAVQVGLGAVHFGATRHAVRTPDRLTVTFQRRFRFDREVARLSGSTLAACGRAGLSSGDGRDGVRHHDRAVLQPVAHGIGNAGARSARPQIAGVADRMSRPILNFLRKSVLY